jgi:hypothetical protein
MNKLPHVILLLALTHALLAAYKTTQQRLDPARVLVLFASICTKDEDGDGVQDSLQLAKIYAEKRGVPESNLLAITKPNLEYKLDFSVVKSTILQQVVDKLNAVGLFPWVHSNPALAEKISP